MTFTDLWFGKYDTSTSYDHTETIKFSIYNATDSTLISTWIKDNCDHQTMTGYNVNILVNITIVFLFFFF